MASFIKKSLNTIMILFFLFLFFATKIGVNAVTTEEWQKVTSTSDLAVGDEIIIVAATADVALSTTQNKNNIGRVAITKNGNFVVIDENVQKLVLEEGKTTDTFALKTVNGDKDQYLYAASSSENYLRKQLIIDYNASWKITIDASSGIATVKAQGSNSRNILKYNSNNSLFSCYSSGQNDITIYKKPVLTYYAVNFFDGTTEYTDLRKENCESGSKITAPENPIKENYVFLGWFKDADCINEWNFSTDLVTTNTNLYAKWGINTLENYFSALSTRASMKISYNVTSSSSSVEVTGQSKVSSNTSLDNSNSASLFNLDEDIFTLIGEKNDSSTVSAINTEGIRLYPRSTNGSSVTISSIYPMKKVIVTFVTNYLNTFEYKASETPKNSVEMSGLVRTYEYETGITSFTIKNTVNATSDNQVRIKSIKITYESIVNTYETIDSETAIRFGQCIAKEKYDELIAEDSSAEFGVIAIKTATLGTGDLTIDTPNAFVQAINPVMVAAEGATEEDLNGSYYQFALVIYGISEDMFDTSFTAVCYVKVNDNYYYMKASNQSLSSLSSIYLNDESLQEYAGILSHIAGN